MAKMSYLQFCMAKHPNYKLQSSSKGYLNIHFIEI